MNRRDFLRTASAGALFAGPYANTAAALQKKIKITDVMGLESDQDRNRLRWAGI